MAVYVVSIGLFDCLCAYERLCGPILLPIHAERPSVLEHYENNTYTVEACQSSNGGSLEQSIFPTAIDGSLVLAYLKEIILVTISGCATIGIVHCTLLEDPQ